MEAYLPRMAEILKNIINDGEKLTWIHDKLRSTNPIYECLDHTYSIKTGNSSDIDDSMRFKYYLQQWQENLCDTHGDGSMHNPNYSINIQARLTEVTRFERLLQWWQNTLWWQKTCAAICDNPFSIILTLSHSLQSMITMINTAGVKQGANNSFMINNYSGTSTQHMMTGLATWKQTLNTNLRHTIYSRVEVAYNSQHGGRNIKWTYPIKWNYFIQQHRGTSNFLMYYFQWFFSHWIVISMFLSFQEQSLIH